MLDVILVEEKRFVARFRNFEVPQLQTFSEILQKKYLQLLFYDDEDI